MSALRALLTGLIDYAGLFPPAALDMQTAVRNYAAYSRGEHAWMLGRFVVPLKQAEAAGPWKLSVIGMSGPPVTDTIELKAESADEIQAPAGVTTYFEIPVAQDPTQLIDVLAERGARAKVRTNGLASEDFARFLHLCAQAHVPFKATAGLHHPIRSVDHGFINVFLAAALLHAGGYREQAIRTLDETSPDAFHFSETGVRWHSHQLTTEQLRAARQTFAISFGSCSFEEPIDDLKALGWL